MAPSDSIQSLKEKIARKNQIDVDDQMLYLQQTQLRNQEKISDHEISNGSSIDLRTVSHPKMYVSIYVLHILYIYKLLQKIALSSNPTETKLH